VVISFCIFFPQKRILAVMEKKSTPTQY